MPRTFTAASTEYITTSLGAGASITGDITLAIIAKAANNTGDRSPFSIGKSGASRRFLTVVGTTGAVRFTEGGVADCNAPTATMLAAQGWVFYAATKTSAGTPRFHTYVYSTNTWIHEDNPGTVANSGTPDSNSYIGSVAGLQPWGGDIAIAGAWAATHTDAQIESMAFDLIAWRQKAPNGLWLLDQASTSMLVPDLTGNGANQSAIVGTTVGTSSLPVFSYGAPIVVRTFLPDVTADGCGVGLENADFILLEDSNALGIEACPPIDLSPATITVTPVALTMSAAVSLALSPATITVTGVALAPSTGGVSLALSPATITDTPVALTITAAVSLALSPAVITITPVALTTSGAVSVALSPATITTTAVALAMTTGSVSLTLPPAHIAVSPEGACALTDDTGRELTDEDGRVLVATSTCNALGITPGGVSLALSPAVITVTPVQLTVTTFTTAQEITLTPCEIAVTPVALTISAARSVTLTPATITVAPVGLTLVAAVDLALGTATITVTPVGLAPTVGAVTVPLSPALIAVLAVALDIAPGAGCLHLTLTDRGTVTVTLSDPHDLALGLTTLTGTATVIVTDAHTVGLTLDDVGATSVLIGECP